MPDKISLTYVTQSSSPLAAFVDFSAASAWPSSAGKFAGISRLSGPGWSWGGVSAIDSNGRMIWIADAHRGDGKRLVVHADDSKRLWCNDNYTAC